MTKSELIQRIAQTQPHLVERDVASAVNMMLEHMAACLAGGGRNPRTGMPVSLSARYAPYFKPGMRLRERLNRGHES